MQPDWFTFEIKIVMAFVDLEDKQPEKQGIYTVKIKTTIGADRICKATWNAKHDFIPIEDYIRGEEYIYEWDDKEF